MARREPTVELTITPDGKVHFKVEGISGQGCEELEQALVAALRGDVESSERTPEYYQGQSLWGRLTQKIGGK